MVCSTGVDMSNEQQPKDTQGPNAIPWWKPALSIPEYGAIVIIASFFAFIALQVVGLVPVGMRPTAVFVTGVSFIVPLSIGIEARRAKRRGRGNVGRGRGGE